MSHFSECNCDQCKNTRERYKNYGWLVIMAIALLWGIAIVHGLSNPHRQHGLPDPAIDGRPGQEWDYHDGGYQ